MENIWEILNSFFLMASGVFVLWRGEKNNEKKLE
jgi:hypothetical protein